MLGTSSSKFDNEIEKIVNLVNPKTILELGCGKGKFRKIIQDPLISIKAVQKTFTLTDINYLKNIGYNDIFDNDILDYFKVGFDEYYDMIVALDVIEHFLHSDAISIIRFALYRSDYLLLVWPSKHPQNAESHQFDRHRTSFELKEVTESFDVVYYFQTGFANVNYQHRYHIALIRGYMNSKNLNPF